MRPGRAVAAAEQAPVDVGERVDVDRHLGAPGRDADGHRIAAPVQAVERAAQDGGVAHAVEGPGDPAEGERGRRRRTPGWQGPARARPPRRRRRWRRRSAWPRTAGPASSLAATVSTATIRVAPAMRSPWITLRPTPPTPKTAAVSPGRTLARFSTAPTPVSTPQPIRQAEDSGISLGMRTACTSLTTVSSEKTEAAAKLEAGSPLKVNGCRDVPERALAPGRMAGAAGPAGATAGQGGDHHVVARLDGPHRVTHRLDDTGALVAEHGRRGERDGPVDDREVRVAHPGRLRSGPAPRSGPGSRTSSASVTSTPSPV